MSGRQDDLAGRMASAASDFVAALPPEQQKRAHLPLDGAEMGRWFYTPTQRAGLPLAEMDAVQQRLAHRLLATGLSTAGYNTAATIMGLENILDAGEGFRARAYAGRLGPSRGRDPLMYFWTVFGDPASDAWAWRVEGHHVSVRHAIVHGRLAGPTPSFFGADPSDYQSMAGLLRPLGRDEDLGRELVQALDERQRSLALLSPAPPSDVVLGNRTRFEEGALPLPLRSIFSAELPPEDAARMDAFDALIKERSGMSAENLEALRLSSTPKGVPATELTSAQRDLLRALLRQYFDRMPADLAEAQATAVEEDGGVALHFAWAGGIERGQPHYYRLQAPRLLIEYENATAAHAHSVWRDPVGDFGADLLSAHYAQEH
jgi:hypothetical protein